MLIKKNNVYFKKVRKNENIILPEDFSIKLIKNIHESLYHISVKQMQMEIGPLYTATILTKNIKKVCKNCEICKKK